MQAQQRLAREREQGGANAQRSRSGDGSRPGRRCERNGSPGHRRLPAGCSSPSSNNRPLPARTRGAGSAEDPRGTSEPRVTRDPSARTPPTRFEPRGTTRTRRHPAARLRMALRRVSLDCASPEGVGRVVGERRRPRVEPVAAAPGRARSRVGPRGVPPAARVVAAAASARGRATLGGAPTRAPTRRRRRRTPSPQVPRGATPRCSSASTRTPGASRSTTSRAPRSSTAAWR